jgi:DNA-binding PadR family transcriptional regulator
MPWTIRGASDGPRRFSTSVFFTAEDAEDAEHSASSAVKPSGSFATPKSQPLPHIHAGYILHGQIMEGDMTEKQDPAQLPLRPAVFHILLALSAGDLHGLGIADEVERASEGYIELGPGTLYRTLSELLDAGLVKGVGSPERDADPRRKYYRISRTGRAVVTAEAERLQRLVGAARSRKVLPA